MKKKLHLSKERLKTLSHNQLIHVVGGSAGSTSGRNRDTIIFSDYCNVLAV
ncbi:MAG TPA: hypothetical protein VEM39_00190 [Myxococcaceae bacterium]|nr:hypothetical protein [Myxococcaceae bacterium]